MEQINELNKIETSCVVIFSHKLFYIKRSYGQRQRSYATEQSIEAQCQIKTYMQNAMGVIELIIRQSYTHRKEDIRKLQKGQLESTF